MAVLYMDGFDHYGAAGATNYISVLGPGNWNLSGTNSSGQANLASMPVLGGIGLHTTPGRSLTTLIYNYHLIPQNIIAGDTIGFGFHFYATSFSGADNNAGIVGIGNGATQIQCLKVQQSGQLLWGSGAPDSGSNLGNSGGNVLVLNTLYHIELKIVFNTGTSGSVEVRVNGQPFMTVTGINTMPSTVTSLIFSPSGTTSGSAAMAAFYFKNFYIWNTSGSINNDWLGERVVDTTLPDADTAQADWTLSTGSDGYDLINDVPADTGTNYIETSTVGDESIFDMSDLSNSSVTIIAVMATVLGEKTTSGDGSIQIGPISNSVSDYSSDLQMTNSQFLYVNHVSELNPDTGLAWTPSDIASVQLGIKRTL